MSSDPDAHPSSSRPTGHGAAQAGICLLAIWALSACAPTLRLGLRVDDPARVERLLPQMRSPFPEQASILNEARIVLRGDTATFFTGQIWYRAPDRMRIQAYSEMGVVLLDVLASEGQVRTLTALPGKLGDQRVAEGMVDDLALIFLLSLPPPPHELREVADGGWDLVAGELGERVVFRFPAEGSRPSAILVERNERLAARLDLAAWTEFGSWVLPSRLDLSRPLLGYTLSIDIVEAHPLPAGERPFRVEATRAE
jgi:hypothetical protein